MANSKIYLCKGINVDKNYLNVLSYGESDMLNLCISKKIAEASDFQFIRESNRINVPFSYNVCMQANYIAFQNPTYSNKWFFAFIDKRNYKSDGATELEYTVDRWSTWFDYWSAIGCYVIREHVNNDAVGANIVPEDFSTDNLDMILYSNQSLSVASSFVYCVGINGVPKATGNIGGAVYGGVPCGYRTVAFSNAAALKDFVATYEEEPDKIVCIYLVPIDFFSPNDTIYDTAGGLYNLSILDNDGYTTPDESITPITPTFGGYTPRNNKLYTYPYCFYKLVNNLNSYMVLARERFDGAPTFRSVGGNSATSSMITFPVNYKKGTGVQIPLEDNIAVNALPSGGWTGSAIGQWQANNGIATAVQATGSIAGTVAGLAMLSNPVTAPMGAAAVAGAAISAGNTIGNLLNTKSQLEHAANPVKGGANNISGLLALGQSALKPRLEGYCLNANIAKVIDNYFTKYGYAIKELKTPNITGRQNYNYIQVQGSVGKGDLPSEAMNKINEICNRGVHIWHSHANIGNFNVSN